MRRKTDTNVIIMLWKVKNSNYYIEEFANELKVQTQ